MSELVEALHEQREWLRVTLNSIGDAVITTDTRGVVTFLNPVAQSLTGWTQEEATGVSLDTVFKIVNEETRRTVENPATKALREGVVVGLANHTLLIAKDGTERPIDDSAAPIDHTNGIAGVVLVFRDVTERRRQERELGGCLLRCENIVATLREPFLILNKDFHVKAANRAFYQTFQVSPQHTEGRLIFELGNHQWDISQLRTLLEEVLPQNHAFHDFEVEHDFPTIGRKIMLLNARRVRSTPGADESILLAIEDITERRQAEAKVRDSESQYRRLFETARDGILILDASSGRIIDSNPFMTELLGYTTDDLVGKELWQIGLFRDIDASRTAFRELQDRGYIRYSDLPLQTKAGKETDVELVSNNYKVDGRLVIQCNIRDIAERKQLERMKVQSEALADMNRRKDEFLAMLSHELRNPLAPIMNAVHLLRRGRADDDPIQQAATVIIERQVGQLVHLVDDLMEVSRISTGRIRLHQDNVDMRAILERAVESVRPLIDRRRHILRVTQHQEPIWLHADPTRLEQVVVNLLTNAAKYTEEGGHIWLSIQPEGDEAVLRVRDSGVGIAPDILPRIFDLFTQAERSLDRSQGGLGVGLTLVQRLVQLHRGTVEAHSQQGVGSEFVVRLPLLAHRESQPQQTVAGPAKNTAHSLRVLVVDDNIDHADSAAMLLRASGHDVRVAYSGQAALDAAVEHRPNVILLDLGLPEMDGYEVARRLRQDQRLKQVRLVALTGYGQDTDRHRTAEAGFKHHLIKPVHSEELEDLLSSLVNEDKAEPM